MLQFAVIDPNADSCVVRLPFGSTVTFEDGLLYTLQRT